MMDLLRNVKPEHYFILNNGFVIKNLSEMVAALEQADDSVFRHHVTPERNDFANWVSHVLGDAALKNRIETASGRGELIRILRERIFDAAAFNPGFDIPPEGEMLSNAPPFSGEDSLNDILMADESSEEGPLLGPEQVSVDAPPDDFPPDLPPEDFPADIPPDIQEGLPLIDSSDAQNGPVQEKSYEGPKTIVKEKGGTLRVIKKKRGSSMVKKIAHKKSAPASKKNKKSSVRTGKQLKATARISKRNKVRHAKPATLKKHKAVSRQKQAINKKYSASPVLEHTPEKKEEIAFSAGDATMPVPQHEDFKQQETGKSDMPLEYTPDEPSIEGDQTSGLATGNEKPIELQKAKQKISLEPKPVEATPVSKIQQAVSKAENEIKQDAKVAHTSAPSSEEVVEVREIIAKPLGFKDIDVFFPFGVSNMCSMLFVGKMSTGKTLTAMKLALAVGKNGGRTIFISFNDSEEKLINKFKMVDDKILDYLNSGNITIRWINPFSVVKEFNFDKAHKDTPISNTLAFVDSLNPNVVIIDSLSSLELSFGEDKISYRNCVDSMLKYFEKMGVISISLKELRDDSELNYEFYENILADTMFYFDQARAGTLGKIKMIKKCPMTDLHYQKEAKKGFFWFLKKK